MSSKMNCPRCGTDENSIDARIDPLTEFLKGYGCYWCGHTWSATDEQRKEHDKLVARLWGKKARMQ